jgi:DNA repair protein SbcC/Rad50
MLNNDIPVQPIQKQLQELMNQSAGLNDQVRELQNNIEANKQALATIDSKLKELDDVGDIYSKLADQDILIRSLREDLESIKKAQENSQRILNQTNDILVKDEENLVRLSDKVRELRSKWTEYGFVNDPNRVDLASKIEAVNNDLSTIQKQLHDIELISAGIAKWKSLENSFQVEREIETLRGSLSDVEFENLIEKEVKECQKKLDFLKPRLTVLFTFASNVSTQLENTHDRIAMINPLWKKLLTRIVLEPRFAETKLESFLHYKKPHANVNVIVHGEEVIAAHVASEAQITDLQFTFLLAMAQKYQWSPWRALLLDDPTQHHDLVHASAVFDLLRDYILDHEFQILLATHDSVQANFLVRKLENDGIPTKLYRLKPGKDGVKAEIR